MSVVRVNQIQDTSPNVAANISGGVVTFTNTPLGITPPAIVKLVTLNLSNAADATISSTYIYKYKFCCF